MSHGASDLVILQQSSVRLPDIPAAEQAKWYLAVCYLNGHEMPKDEHKASALFQEAALRGHADSAFELFKIFSKGSGLEKEAQQWLQRAAQVS